MNKYYKFSSDEGDEELFERLGFYEQSLDYYSRDHFIVDFICFPTWDKPRNKINAVYLPFQIFIYETIVNLNFVSSQKEAMKIYKGFKL